MKGTILEYNEAEGTGIISAEDGNRYAFTATDVVGGNKFRKASKVDFNIIDGKAREIYKAISSVESLSGEKNKVVAGILAIFLGVFGAHKFYLSQTKQGLVRVGLWFLGMVLIVTMIGAIIGYPLILALSIIGFVEGLVMLTKPADEFERIYVEEGKAWF